MAPPFAFDPAGLRLARLVALLERFILEEGNRSAQDLGPVRGFLKVAESLLIDRPRLETDWLRWTLMPRSDHFDERWFMRVVQGTHLTFATVTELEQQAITFA